MNADFSQNKLFRYAIYLPKMVFRYTRRIAYRLSNDSKELRQYKDIYKGQRCFVIGNGPSLTTNDLELLNNEITFGTNRVYSIFSQTKWKPTFYLAIDNNILKDNLQEIKNVKAQKKFINITSKVYGYEKDENSIFINMFGPYLIDPFSYQTKEVGRDVSKYFTLSYSVTGVALELAIYMGFSEIYLLGVDNSYSRSIDKNGQMKEDDSIKDYFGTLKSNTYTIQYSDATNSYYAAFRRYAEEHGIKICNATRGGKLEVFERVNFDSVIDSDGLINRKVK